MTPTEQDKELREAIGDVILGYGHAKIKSFEAACNEAMQLITADRKRVELEARIDERNKIALDTYRGKTVSEATNWQAKFEYFMYGNEKRIAKLKAQQEKVNEFTLQDQPRNLK